jgi:hypothetical protein
MKVKIGKGIESDVDVDRLFKNAEVRDHVIYIGLRNILMDAHSRCTKEDDGDNYVEASRAAAERKLEAMYNGEVRSPGGGAREVDPVKVEAQRFATAQVKKHFKQIGREADAKTIRQSAAKLIETNPSIMRTAKKNVDAANAAKLDMSAIA